MKDVIEFIIIYFIVFCIGVVCGLFYRNDKDVNNDGEVNSQDYIELRKEMMKDECYVNGGWNCE